MVNIIINDLTIQVEPDSTILSAAIKAGIKIPTLCYHPELTPYGACRVCLVEIISGGRPGIQASCLYKVSEGLVVKTDTERVQKSRKVIFELLLAMSPESEVLKKLAAEYGVTQSRIHGRELNCILCGLCERACAQISERHAISFANRGPRRRIGTPFKRVSEACIGCGACAHVCPTKIIKIESAE